MDSGFCANRFRRIDDMLAEVGNTEIRSQVMAMVERCPSGSYVYSTGEGQPDIEPDLPQQLGIRGVSLAHDVATEVRDALEFGVQVDVLLPVGNGLRRIVADTADLEKLLPRSPQDRRRIAEMLQQLPHAHRANVFDQIQGHQGFDGLHAREITAWPRPVKPALRLVWHG